MGCDTKGCVRLYLTLNVLTLDIEKNNKQNNMHGV